MLRVFDAYCYPGAAAAERVYNVLPFLLQNCRVVSLVGRGKVGTNGLQLKAKVEKGCCWHSLCTIPSASYVAYMDFHCAGAHLIFPAS